MRLSDFDFDLPPELIAQHPGPRRADSRLLHVARDALVDLRFRDLPTLLVPGDLLVFNDTRVIRARLHGTKDTGGRVETLVERVLDEHEALVQLRASKPPRPGTRLHWRASGATVLARQGEFWRLRFDDDVPRVPRARGRTAAAAVHRARARSGGRGARYQTVYAREPGSVAAPTAGLHFDEAMLQQLRERGVHTAFVTLHVGAGTSSRCASTTCRSIGCTRSAFTCRRKRRTRSTKLARAASRIVAVGTTSLRTLESAADAQGHIAAGSAETSRSSRPIPLSRRRRAADELHLPRSTLLMLVSAFAGIERARAAYAHAIARRYRFFSYGDAMLLEPGDD